MINKIKEILIREEKTISCAESLTSGNVQALLGSISGSSNFYVGGICAYNIDQKVKHLGVDREFAEQCDCVAPLVAVEMSQGARELFGSDISIATTGYITSGDNWGAHAFWAINIEGMVTTGLLQEGFGEDRVSNQRWVASFVLDKLLELLNNRYAI